MQRNLKIGLMNRKFQILMIKSQKIGKMYHEQFLTLKPKNQMTGMVNKDSVILVILCYQKLTLNMTVIDDMDGDWEAPHISNPEYKGEWKQKMIDNPKYKGPWKVPLIPNPAYKVDKLLHVYNTSYVGFDL